MRSFKTYLIWAILLLALIGLSYELMTNAIGFITRILVGIGIITVLVLLYRMFMAKRSGTSAFSTNRSFQSVRQTVSKGNRTSHSKKVSSIKLASKNRMPKRALNRKDQPHLTVIEGKKNRRRSRALF